MKKCKTTYADSVLDPKFSTSLFDYLRENIEWEEGVRSKKGFTRRAKGIGLKDIHLVEQAVNACLINMTTTKYAIHGIYLNYYQDGEMWTPNHSHIGSHQLVISLGGTRTLVVGKKEYKMKNGDAVIFGSAIHGVPKEETKEARISIATFMVPL